MNGYSAISLIMLWCFCQLATAWAEETVLVLRGAGTAFEEATRGIRENLEADLKVEEMILDSTSEESMVQRLANAPPSIVVLMENRVIRMFRRYQAGLTDTTQVIPVVAIMGVFVDQEIKTMKNTVAVSYEAPVVTAAVTMRAAFNIPLRKIGIVHRAFLDDCITREYAYCKREGISIVNTVLPDDSAHLARNLQKALTRLLAKDKVDALWIPNDIRLLRPEIIVKVWVPIINKYKKPVIVGVKTLVEPVMRMGTFAVLPDHIELGSQAADLVTALQENGWKCNEKFTQPVISVYKIVNLPQAREFCGVRRGMLVGIESILDTAKTKVER